MGEPSRPPPPGPPPITVPPSMAAKESILKRAQQVAKAHLGEDGEEEKKISSEWRDYFDEQRQKDYEDRVQAVYEKAGFHVVWLDADDLIYEDGNLTLLLANISISLSGLPSSLPNWQIQKSAKAYSKQRATS